MKFKFIIGLLLITVFCFSQDEGTFQVDSIYKTNKVKTRIWYTSPNNKLFATSYFDTEGRLIKFKLEPCIDGKQITTYYSYDNNGLLISQVDTILNGKPDKAQTQQFEKSGLGFLLSDGDSNKPPMEISKYKIEYDNNSVIKITQFKPDGKLDNIISFKKGGGKQTKEWYRNDEVYEISTTEYLKKNLKEKYYGWEKISDGSKMKWNYQYNYIFKNGQVNQRTWLDGKKTIVYTYNPNGLLIKYEGADYTQEYFEYDYY